MDRRLLSPKWVAAHLVVLAVAAVFSMLGVWQLDRLDEQREMNRIGAERFAMDPVPFEALEGEDPEAIEFRRVIVTGRALTDGEILIRSQVHLGVSGFHLIVPVSHRAAGEVLVNRGWVPLDAEVGTNLHSGSGAPLVTVGGWIHLTQRRPPLGPPDPADGKLTVMNRVDIERIRQQTDSVVNLAGVYIVEMGEWGSEPPFTVAPPEFDDDGPHLGYAIQWFGFALVTSVGYYFLARQRLGRQAASKGRARSSTTS